MLSILYSDFEQFGCPNCGCDAARGSCVSGGGLLLQLVDIVAYTLK